MKSRVLDPVMEDVDKRLLAGKFDDAIDLLHRAREKDPSNSEIPERLGDVYRSLERPSDAINAYEGAIAFEPKRGELWAKKGDALIDAGDGDAAFEAFREASRRTPGAFTEVDWNLRGDRCYSYEDFATARRLYQGGLAVRQNAEGWRGLGLIEAALGRLDEAVKAYRKALDLEPEHGELLNDFGRVRYEQGKLSDALTLFTKAASLVPEDANIVYNLALVRCESGDFRSGRDAYLRVIEITPDDPEAWIGLGLCELELGEGEIGLRKALGSFERAVEVDESAFWGWNNAGSVLSDLGDYDLAVERLDRAIALDETEILPWSNKIWALVDSGDISRAEDCADEMLKVVDDEPEALLIKGRLLADWTFKSTEALEVLRAALALRPGDVSIEADIAEVLMKVGEYADGRAEARKLLKLELDEHVRCAMLFIIYAAYVLEATTSPKRRDAFREFIEYYRSHFVSDDAEAVSWNYRGLAQMIHRNSSRVSEESAFLLTMAIDLQLGTINTKTATFFTGRPDERPSRHGPKAQPG